MSFFSLRRWFGPNETSPVSVTSNEPELSQAEGNFRKGLKFASGQGEEQNYEQAAHCYALSAEMNHALAQFNLAVMYGQGQGVARDEAKSLMWMTRAAELGDAGAQYQLGVRGHATNRTGREATVSEQRIEAFKWTRLSADQGYRGAENGCEFMTLDMTRAEVGEATRRAASFVASKAA